MLSIPQNSRVRRRLFEADDIIDEARVDNFANILQESIKRDCIEMSNKYNFDFKNDVPLEGSWEWYKNCTDAARWIGVKTELKCEENENFYTSLKSENEVTPRSHDGEVLPVLRKRRRVAEVVTDKAVRRKISFD